MGKKVKRILPQRRSKEVMIQGGNSDLGQNHLRLSGSSLVSEFHSGVFYFFLKYNTSLRNFFSEDLLVVNYLNVYITESVFHSL